MCMCDESMKFVIENAIKFFSPMIAIGLAAWFATVRLTKTSKQNERLEWVSGLRKAIADFNSCMSQLAPLVPIINRLEREDRGRRKYYNKADGLALTKEMKQNQDKWNELNFELSGYLQNIITFMNTDDEVHDSLIESTIAAYNSIQRSDRKFDPEDIKGYMSILVVEYQHVKKLELKKVGIKY